MKKRKLILIIIAIIAIPLVAFSAYFICTDTFEYWAGKGSVDKDLHIEVIMCSGDNLITESKYYADEMAKFSQENKKISEVFKKYDSGEYKKPINIDAEIEIEKGKTIYTYSGTITTKDDKTIDYYQSFSVDCVPTFKIPEEFKPEK